MDKPVRRLQPDVMTRSTDEQARLDRWCDRATAILDGCANGKAVPVLQALARRRHIGGMVTLANRMLDIRTNEYDPKRGLQLERTIARREGLSYQLQNLSTSYRNLGDMAGYRFWLNRAARLGDPEVVAERRRFRTRFPYAVMKKWRRYRPYRSQLDG